MRIGSENSYLNASSMMRRWRRAALVAGAAAVLAGCAALYDRQGFVGGVTGGPDSRVDRAIAALAQGDWRLAEQEADQAIFLDGSHPRGLLVMGIVYQNTGRPEKARKMYEELLASDASEVIAAGPWGHLQPRPIKEVAEANLRLLEGPSTEPLPRAEGALTVQRAQGQPGFNRAASVSLTDGDGEPVAVEPVMTAEAENLMNRFRVLEHLRAEGLITADEYAKRRAANIGALLPLSARPPAAGLDRPVPSAEEVVDRLEALRRAFEGRAITAAHHAAERTAILDGLLPAEPRARERALNPPDGLLEAAAMMGRLERVREESLVSADEFNRERAAIRKVMQAGSARGSGSASPAAARAPAPPPKPEATDGAQPNGGLLVPASDASKNPAAVVKSGRQPLEVVPNPTDVPPGPENGVRGVVSSVPAPPAPTTPAGVQQGAAVHLESYRSREDAEKGWEVLKRKFPELSNLDVRITEARVPGRGLYYRLNAGPLSTEAEARALCGRLQGQWCEPVFIGG